MKFVGQRRMFVTFNIQQMVIIIFNAAGALQCQTPGWLFTALAHIGDATSQLAWLRRSSSTHFAQPSRACLWQGTSASTVSALSFPYRRIPWNAETNESVKIIPNRTKFGKGIGTSV